MEKIKKSPKEVCHVKTMEIYDNAGIHRGAKSF